MEGLFFAVDNAGLSQLSHAAGDHLGVNSKVVFLHEVQSGSVGDVADTQLDSGSVGHQVGYVFADLHIHLTGGTLLKSHDGLVALIEVVHIGNMNLHVAVGLGQIGVDLQNDHLGHLGGSAMTLRDMRK